MSNPSSFRTVSLIDGRTPERSLIEAQVYRDYPYVELENIELQWADARERAATTGNSGGLAPMEHAHWDWRNKTGSVEAEFHMLVAVECAGFAQGLMAVWRSPRLSRLGDGSVVYVDYVESAPWNLKGLTTGARFLGVGTVLLAEAVRLSLEMGLSGAIGLHSLPQAEGFYTRCGMSRVGPDPDYFDLAYFEFTGENAICWLKSIGEKP